MTTHIRIEPYRPEWPEEFQRLAAPIRDAAPPGARLHHIGSTAVPGLAAKDVIDLQLTVASLDAIDVAAFGRIGFEHTAIRLDHCPPGADLPEEELTKRFFRCSIRPAHLHVRQAGRFNQRYPLLCRDYLRAHPDAARAYETIKQRLAERFPHDADAYYDIKDPVFDVLMAGANEWAKHTGWQEPPAD